MCIVEGYTYHDLNWFSNTGIIRWHMVSQRRIAGLVALWLVSLALCGSPNDSASPTPSACTWSGNGDRRIATSDPARAGFDP